MNPPTNNASKFIPTLYSKKTVKKMPKRVLPKGKPALQPKLNNKPMK